MMNFTSSAINNIVMNDDDTVSITFSNGREYLYDCSDLDGFQNDLQNVIDESESVGKFVNRAIRAQLLQLSAAQPVAV
jgi:hypothetical protein